VQGERARGRESASACRDHLSVGERHSWSTLPSRARAHQHDSERPGATTGNASPSGTSLSLKEGDAFLVRVRMWDMALLMGEGLYTNCSFGMRRPYIWVMFSGEEAPRRAGRDPRPLRVIGLFSGQLDGERRPASLCAFHVDLPAVRLYQLPGDGQPEAAAQPTCPGTGAISLPEAVEHVG